MKTPNLFYFFTILLLFFSTTISLKAQCEWLYEDRDETSYSLNNGIELFYCDNVMDTIYAPNQYIDVYWQYNNENGDECQDWDWIGNNYFFSLNSDDPCLENLTGNLITVTFIGKTSLNENIPADTCVFDIKFLTTGNPIITTDSYDINTQITLCEESLITLYADDDIGVSGAENYNSIQWYLNGEAIDSATNPELNISETNYDINSSNIFYFTFSNYCTDLYDLNQDSEWLTISIYEGYDECEPCSWNLPDYDNNEFYGFCIECEGGGYFPEKPDNEEDRSIEDSNLPTCEATIYRITIYNRLGRELFQSDYDNHPWNGKSKNGKKYKEGTYYYKMEYVLNPYLPEDNQNETKIKTGTVYLDWGN